MCKVHVIFFQTLELYQLVDNIGVDAETGDLWVAALSKPWITFQYLADPTNSSINAPAKVSLMRAL